MCHQCACTIPAAPRRASAILQRCHCMRHAAYPLPAWQGLLAVQRPSRPGATCEIFPKIYHTSDDVLIINLKPNASACMQQPPHGHSACIECIGPQAKGQGPRRSRQPPSHRPAFGIWAWPQPLFCNTIRCSGQAAKSLFNTAFGSRFGLFNTEWYYNTGCKNTAERASSTSSFLSSIT